jgi:ankyrin repeat protein
LIILLSFSLRTPLHHSASNGHLDVCRLLLQCNADVNAKDNW